MKNVILDTNAYSHLIDGDEHIFDVISTASCVYFPIFVLAELLSGFKNGKKAKANREVLDRFISKPTVSILNTSSETAEIFSGITTTLKKKGKLIPIHDMWIAAQTIETGSVLITYDKHFKNIPGLRMWDY